MFDLFQKAYFTLMYVVGVIFRHHFLGMFFKSVKMNFEHQRIAKSLKRVYQLIKQPYMCIYVLPITQNHDKECIVASSGNTFWSKFKKCETKGFFHQFLLQYTSNNVY